MDVCIYVYMYTGRYIYIYICIYIYVCIDIRVRLPARPYRAFHPCSHQHHTTLHHTTLTLHDTAQHDTSRNSNSTSPLAFLSRRTQPCQTARHRSKGLELASTWKRGGVGIGSRPVPSLSTFPSFFCPFFLSLLLLPLSASLFSVV
jgi:hypothetical protein